uniref:Mating factor receptor STE3-1 n=1 Tax=Limonomyces culmigenus TaxID=228944 RepID=A0A0P0KEW4_9AGAM|nr:mating factor receptor STE3-1 [Limonomyces culmigenus]
MLKDCPNPDVRLGSPTSCPTCAAYISSRSARLTAPHRSSPDGLPLPPPPSRPPHSARRRRRRHIMSNPVTTAYAACVFLSMIMVLIPIRWHLQAWNTGTCLYMIWVGIGCLLEFVNATVWANDAILRVPVWCDISVHLQTALSVAIPCCTLVINRRLYKIASVRTVLVTKEDKRRDMYTDLAIGVGFPFLIMILFYVSQGHRFDIFEELGCQPALYVTLPSIFLFSMWPIVIGCCSGVYTCLILYTFMKRRAQFNKLVESNASLTMSRYWRLMCLASMEIVFTVPLACYVLSLNIKSGINPWISWANVHFDFFQINQYASLEWRSEGSTIIMIREVSRWSYVLCAVIFFAFFGFAAEARKNYRSAFDSLASIAGRSRSKTAVGSGSFGGSKPAMSGGSLPVFIRKEKMVNTDSSFGTLSIPDINSYGEFEKADLKLSISPSQSVGSTSFVSPIDSFSPTDTFHGTSSSGGKSSRPATPDSDRGEAPRLPSDMV